MVGALELVDEPGHVVSVPFERGSAVLARARGTLNRRARSVAGGPLASRKAGLSPAPALRSYRRHACGIDSRCRARVFGGLHAALLARPLPRAGAGRLVTTHAERPNRPRTAHKCGCRKDSFPALDPPRSAHAPSCSHASIEPRLRSRPLWQLQDLLRPGRHLLRGLLCAGLRRRDRLDSRRSTTLWRHEPHGFDAVGLGTQDFARGLAHVQSLIDSAQFEVLASNLRHASTQLTSLVSTYRIVEPRARLLAHRARGDAHNRSGNREQRHPRHRGPGPGGRGASRRGLRELPPPLHGSGCSDLVGFCTLYTVRGGPLLAVVDAHACEDLGDTLLDPPDSSLRLLRPREVEDIAPPTPGG